MGIRSTDDWSGTQVNGVTLGVPAYLNPVYDEDGNVTAHDGYIWDGGVPTGEIADDDKFHLDATDSDGAAAEPVDVVTFFGVEVDTWAQPTGAHDAYPQGAFVEVDGATWVSITPANVHAPGVSGWRRIGEDANEVFPWVQPTGGHDAYPLGAIVEYNGQTWENTGSAANVWAPGVFGWVVI